MIKNKKLFEDIRKIVFIAYNYLIKKKSAEDYISGKWRSILLIENTNQITL